MFYSGFVNIFHISFEFPITFFLKGTCVSLSLRKDVSTRWTFNTSEIKHCFISTCLP